MVMRGGNQCGSAYCGSHKIHIYHICTKGLESGLLFHDAEDYQAAVNLIAILSCVQEINVFAYCLMTNHIHVVAGAQNRNSAEMFGAIFKKEYSQHYTRRYGKSKVFKSITLTVKELSDSNYIRNCIAYVLRNPVDGGLVKAAEKYEWSSMPCYFSDGSGGTGIPLSAMGVRNIRNALRTRRDIKNCGKLAFDGTNGVVPRSFVEYGFVESLFNNSVVNFCLSISKVDSAQMEYDLAIRPRVRFNDYELLARIDMIIKKWFDADNIRMLTIRQKCKMAGYMSRYCNAGIPQISRILGLERNLVGEILGRENTGLPD